MPEISDLICWNKVQWDNMCEEVDSGGGHLQRRAYYYRIVDTGNITKILLISAKPSTAQVGFMHATDYLRLDRSAFEKLKAVGDKFFGSAPP